MSGKITLEADEIYTIGADHLLCVIAIKDENDPFQPFLIKLRKFLDLFADTGEIKWSRWIPRDAEDD